MRSLKQRVAETGKRSVRSWNSCEGLGRYSGPCVRDSFICGNPGVMCVASIAMNVVNIDETPNGAGANLIIRHLPARPTQTKVFNRCSRVEVLMVWPETLENCQKLY
jgi:hypothetical protein